MMSEQAWMELFDQCVSEMQTPLLPQSVCRLFTDGVKPFSKWWAKQNDEMRREPSNEANHSVHRQKFNNHCFW